MANTPYYLPTNGIYKDSIKDKECNINMYPENIRAFSSLKCYEYDSKKRVIRRSVFGSGVSGVWKYKYDKFDRIIEINGMGDNYKIKYHKKYNLLEELVKNLPGNFEERVAFFYD